LKYNHFYVIIGVRVSLGKQMSGVVYGIS
jgi:hypothetical protein